VVTKPTRGSSKALLQNRRKSVKVLNKQTLTSGGFLNGIRRFFIHDGLRFKNLGICSLIRLAAVGDTCND